MVVKCCTFEEMSLHIKSNHLRIIMVGAGVLGTITVPEILRQQKIDHLVECYIDNDEKIWNSNIDLNGNSIIVKSMGKLTNIDSANIAILLNISRYSEILEQLNRIQNLKNVICYIMPMMCIHNFKQTEMIGALKDNQIPRIPKVIHYMWLGKQKIPLALRKCMETWTQYCPDYEIVQWNESNYDVNKHIYMKEAYEQGAYGFIPDYARLDILHQYGGIYLDTDVELIKSLDGLLYEEAFCGVEKWQVLNFGGCSGAVKGNEMIYHFMQSRKNIHFNNKDGSQNRRTCGYYDTRTAMKYGYQLTGKVQKIHDMNIYTSDYFHPYDYMSGRTQITRNTYSIHRFNGGWLSQKMKRENVEVQKAFEQEYLEALKV